FSSRRRHTRSTRDWSSDVCSSDLTSSSSLRWSHKLGIVCGSSAGYWMKSGNLRSPDVSFIAKERLQGLRHAPKKFFQGAPDLVVKILSPSDAVDELHEKIVEYFESGARLNWVLNPEEETVLVYL